MTAHSRDGNSARDLKVVFADFKAGVADS